MKPETKRIVIFGINYAPELTGIAPYTTELAEHLARKGHSVRVATGVPHYPVWRRLPIPSPNGVSNPSVHRYRHFVPRRANAFGRMLYEVTWFFSAMRTLIGRRPDVILGVVPSLSGAVLAIVGGRVWRAPVGLIVKDLMGPAASQSGYRGGAAVAKITGKVEAAVLRRADRVAVISDGFVPYLRQAGVARDSIHRVRDWTHPGQPTESVASFRVRIGWAPSDFVCLHAGNMGQKQGLDNVLDAAALLRHRSPRIRIVLSGDGNDRSRLVARSQRLSLCNVTFLELQKPGRYEAMLAAADLLLLNQRGSVGDMSLPSKLASYFAAGRPVVAAVAPGSPAAREVEQSGGGVVIPADKPDGLAEVLLELSLRQERASLLGARGKAYAVEQLSREAALTRYEDFLDHLTGTIPTVTPDTAAVSCKGTGFGRSE